jgi:methylmalonyl-CoA mutase cobalamin-binding subunit
MTGVEPDFEELLPTDLPSGADLVQAGRARARAIQVPTSRYCLERKVRSERDFKVHARAHGIQTTFINIGYETWQETADVLNELAARGRAKGYVVDRATLVVDRRMGLPPELRPSAVRETGLMFHEDEEWLATGRDVGTQCQYADHNLFSPAAVLNTEAAMKAGISYIGNLSQISWRWPPWDDDVARFCRTVEALGMISAKRQLFVVENYQDDGFPGSFYDVATMLGWALFMRHITDLVGVDQSQTFGSQWSDPVLKQAYGLALDAINPVRIPPAVIHADTNSIGVGDDFDRNAALVAIDAYFSASREQRWPTGAAIHVTPVTEAVRIPTVDDLDQSMMIGSEAIARACATPGIVDWRPIEQLRDRMLEGGRRVFANILAGLTELGVDVKDPLQLLLAGYRIGAAKLEELFNAGNPDPAYPRGFEPVVMSEVARRLLRWRDDEIARIRGGSGLPDLSGVKVVAASGDIHEYGLFVVTEVLRRCRAAVIDLGTSVGSDEIAKVAREAAADAVAVSTLNGGALGFARSIQAELDRRGIMPALFLGGRLTETRGDTNSVDVHEDLRRIGVHACDTMDDMVREIRQALASPGDVQDRA